MPLAALVLASAIGAGPALAANRPKRPNIVLVRTDDQTAAQLAPRFMPRTERLLVHHGTRFTQSIVTTPECCPSRAGVLTGQYGHNNGVLTNNPGYPSLHEKRNTLPVWLHRAGYRTAHLGKYLNGYTRVAHPRTAIAPGWDLWQTTYQGSSNYYHYLLSDNGHRVRYGVRARDNVTSVLNRKAVHIVRRFGGGRKPLYLQLDQRAPHVADGPTKGRCTGNSPQPVRSDLNRFSNEPLPKPPSFNEADVSDKPSFLQLPPLDSEKVANIQLRYQCTLASLLEVDRGVRELYEAFRHKHALGHTVFIFTSDNGLFEGEHRIGGGKSLSYEESIRVPLVIRLPRAYRRAARVSRVSEPVANIDLPPTILALAHAKPCNRDGCRTMDGRSLLGLLRGRKRSWPRNRAIVTEFKDANRPRVNVCAYSGIRLPDRLYVQYSRAVLSRGQGCQATNASELYELGTDPFELDNVADNPSHQDETARLRARLRRLRRCAGIAGRDHRVGTRPFCD